jgi:hypothetical protein
MNLEFNWTMLLLALAVIGIMSQMFIWSVNKPPHDPFLDADGWDDDDEWPLRLVGPDGKLMRARPISDEFFLDSEEFKRRNILWSSEQQKDAMARGPRLCDLGVVENFSIPIAGGGVITGDGRGFALPPIERDPEVVVKWSNIEEVRESYVGFDFERPICTPGQFCISEEEAARLRDAWPMDRSLRFDKMPDGCQLWGDTEEDSIWTNPPGKVLQKICSAMLVSGAEQIIYCSEPNGETDIAIPEMKHSDWRREFTKVAQCVNTGLKFQFSGYDGCWLLSVGRA